MIRPAPLLFVLLFALVAGPPLSAQEPDTDARYHQLREAYTQRSRDIEERYRTASRELLNKFILALVRAEQQFRDDGDLEGVMASRELRESLLEDPTYPKARETHPERLLDMIATLHEHRDEARKQHQAKLDDLNRMLLEALEPFQRAYTIRGNIDKAIDIRNARLRLEATLAGTPLGEVSLASRATSTASASAPTVSTDPNAYPFCLEPALYESVPGVTPRVPAISYEIETDGNVEIAERGFEFDNGQMRIPANALSALRDQVGKNQMLTVEFGVYTEQRIQWQTRGNPAPLLIYGESLRNANLAVTQEEENLYLYLRTTEEGPHGGLHRVDLGRIEANLPQHIILTYRSGEAVVFRNGSEAGTFRDMNGLLSNWEDYPVIMGRVPAPTPVEEGAPEHLRWRGRLLQFYMKASLDSGRKAMSNFNRFSSTITQ